MRKYLEAALLSTTLAALKTRPLHVEVTVKRPHGHVDKQRRKRRKQERQAKRKNR